MEARIILTCTTCNKNFDRLAKEVNYQLKLKSDTKFYCSSPCKITSVNKNCNQCGKEIIVNQSRLKKYFIHFCNSSCRAIFNNKKRIENGFTLKGKIKIVRCTQCYIDTEIALNASSKFAICKICNDKNIINEIKKHGKCKPTKLLKTIRTHICIICQNEFESRRPVKKLCYNPECKKRSSLLAGKKGGTKSVQVQQRRSKNEALFANLCLNNNLHIKCNEQLFIDHNGSTWDADIILPELKIAVLWNGAWHYKIIKTDGSLEQIQTRDKIKFDVIKNNGYYPYVIKDMGRYNEQFVQEKFNEFLEFIKTDYLGKLNNQEEIDKYLNKVQENVNLKPKREKAKPIKLVCDYCQKEFERNNNNRPELKGSKNVYCSRPCLWNSLRRKK